MDVPSLTGERQAAGALPEMVQLEATEPCPVPAIEIWSASVMMLNCAATATGTVPATIVQVVLVPAPEHAPDQPAKLELDLGVAVKTMVVPAFTLVEQAIGAPEESPQLIASAACEVMAPWPVPPRTN